MKNKTLFWLPVIGLVLFFSFYKSNKKNKKIQKFDDNHSKTNQEPDFPLNIAAREFDYKLN
jgi:hypothetical protein